MDKKIGFFKAYGKMWKNIFNYSSTATRKEYWCPFFFNLFWLLADAGILWACYNASEGNLFTPGGEVNGCLLVTAVVITAYLLISLLPFVSLTVRRLHDTGRSGWYSILLLLVGAGTVIVLVWCIGAGARFFKASANREVCVYGPPEMIEEYNKKQE